MSGSHNSSESTSLAKQETRPGYLPAADAPHHLRQTDRDPRAAKRAERQVALMFTISMLLTVAAIIAFLLIPAEESIWLPIIGETQALHVALGVTIGGAILLVGIGVIHWSKQLMTGIEVVQERHPLKSPEDETAEALASYEAGVEQSGFVKYPIIRRTMIGAMMLVPLPFIFLLRDLWVTPKDSASPAELKSETLWRKGERIVSDITYRPVKAEDIPVGGLVNCVPESLPDVEEEEGLLNARAKAALILIRMRPDEIVSEQSEGWSYQGILAYSKICTHVGCPISLYEQRTHHLLCPCHQSTFDLADSGNVVFGPAARRMPQLPIGVDDEGYLIAMSDFAEPVGPSFFEREGERMSAIVKAGGGTATYVDERVTTNRWLKRNLNKVFPEHWSFLLGEVVLYSFIVILLSGIYLTLFFKPSMVEVVYDGTYAPLKGVRMSEAYASTLDISFDVRGGLLMRQIHHWAALIFVAAMAAHMFRVFFTGAFRKPRELNWVIGVILTTLALGAGFTGYSLPDDLLSGTGMRIIEGVILSIPLVGTWISFFLFGGEFPGDDVISRLYGMHILLIPGLILGMLTIHLMLVWYQKHTQFPGPGRTNDNVVGYPFMPVYMAKAGGFFFLVFGLIVVVAGVVTINPVWLFGPYTPDQVSAGTQPDWYIGWIDGALRVMPNLELVLFGYTISLNVLIPAAVIPGIIFTLLGVYPWLERWATGDYREHNILDRPRNNPTRTGLGVMAITFYTLLMAAGGNDIIALAFNLSINELIWFFRISVIVLPPIMFVITKRMCLSLQRRDRDKLLHGYETGRVLRLPDGEFIEAHGEVSIEERGKILGKEDLTPVAAPPKEDRKGVRNPKAKIGGIRSSISHFFLGDTIARPSQEELDEAAHHVSEAADIEAPLREDDALVTVIGDGGVLHHPGQPLTNREQHERDRKNQE